MPRHTYRRSSHQPGLRHAARLARFVPPALQFSVWPFDGPVGQSSPLRHGAPLPVRSGMMSECMWRTASTTELWLAHGLLADAVACGARACAGARAALHCSRGRSAAAWQLRRGLRTPARCPGAHSSAATAVLLPQFPDGHCRVAGNAGQWGVQGGHMPTLRTTCSMPATDVPPHATPACSFAGVRRCRRGGGGGGGPQLFECRERLWTSLRVCCSCCHRGNTARGLCTTARDFELPEICAQVCAVLRCGEACFTTACWYLLEAGDPRRPSCLDAGRPEECQCFTGQPLHAKNAGGE